MLKKHTRKNFITNFLLVGSTGNWHTVISTSCFTVGVER